MIHPASANEQAAMLISMGIGLVGLVIVYIIARKRSKP